MNNEHLIQLCVDFDLGTPIQIDTNREGVSNTSHNLTTDKGKFFVKMVREKKKKYIHYIAEAEAFMRSRDIPAVGMLATKRGETFVTYDANMYTMYPFIESIRTHRYDFDEFQEMGKMLGRIHRAGSSNVPATLREHLFSEKPTARVTAELHSYRSLIAAKSHPDEPDELFRTYIDLKLKMLDETLQINPLPLDTLTHGDYHARNLLMDSNHAIVGICDWEQAAMNARSYELARAILYTCYAGEGEEEPHRYDNTTAEGFAQAFLSGYASVYPILATELAHGIKLRWKRLIQSFWIEEQYYTNGDTRSYKFIPHEIRLIQDFAEPEIIERICQYARVAEA